ncbi:MAG: glycosyltransferase [Saprospiraceae bacterium]|nr:glycosyltransferase [Pyrinomonadaceae bacterium]
MESPKISLVIPIRDEEESIENLLESINRQTYQPDEVVLVDGGSTDKTVEIVERMAAGNSKIKLIKTDEATPGKARNIGIENAANDWIALTDAGIKLEPDWLAELVIAASSIPPRQRKAAASPDQGGELDADIVYGNFSPVNGNFFEKCAAISYVPSQKAVGIRGKIIASCLLRKGVWEAVGGFPDLRAAEDLIFMEKAEKQDFKIAIAPKAMVFWSLQPALSSTFAKFVLYSKHNVWAGRQWDWHYGVLKQYLILLPFLIMAAVHSLWWLAAIPLWLLARTAKRILAHRYEFGMGILFNPLIVFGVAGLILVIDTATFAGWFQAVLYKK